MTEHEDRTREPAPHCTNCGGGGRVGHIVDRNGPGGSERYHWRTCPKCEGTGEPTGDTAKSEDRTVPWYEPGERASAILALARRVSSLRHGTAADESTCKLCMRPSGEDFNAPEEEWDRVVGIDCIVCRECYALLGGAHPGAAKSEDRTVPPPGWRWWINVDGSCSFTHVHIDALRGTTTLSVAWAHYDAIAKPAYDRGFAAGRAAAEATATAAVAGACRHLHDERDALRAELQALQYAYTAICEAALPGQRPAGAEATATAIKLMLARSEAHNERMREEGDARTLAACIELASDRGFCSGGIDAANALDRFAELLRIGTGEGRINGADALAKRDERMREEGRAEERATVTSWLRSPPTNDSAGGYADAIDDGVHLHYGKHADALAKREAAARAPLERRIAELVDIQDQSADALMEAMAERDALRADVARLEKELDSARGDVAKPEPTP